MNKRKGNLVAPTSTGLLLRTMLFQSTQRPRRIEDGEWIETKYGQARVVGRLGQRHADLLDSILYHAEAARAVPGGGIDLLVDPARVRVSMWTGGRRGAGPADRRYSMQRIEKLLTDLTGAVIEIRSKHIDVSAKGSLIAHRLPSKVTRTDPRTGEDRHLWTVRVGAVLAPLLDKDLLFYYDPSAICRLDHGVSQAIARHVLSHKTEPVGGWRIDTLIRAVSGELAGQALWDARRRLRADADGLAAAGVIVDGDRVRLAGGMAQRPSVRGGKQGDPGTAARDPGTAARGHGTAARDMAQRPWVSSI